MNFLAHLHLATLAQSSLLGNLMADFVRGDPDGLYPPAVVAGIRMHRRIDSLTDGHQAVRQALTLFSPATRRVAPIALDVVWDHFLERHWSQVEPQWPLTEFVVRAQQGIAPALPDTPAGFQSLNRYLWRERWLLRYAELPFLAQVLSGMAQRRPRLSALGEIHPEIQTHYSRLQEAFWQLYPAMMQAARQGVLGH
ncbi:DUF479 domain-containing protein [Candidatus Sodalis endolongispinus]|uniref:DUF479 domain-containing protein n=1 Tax=Candidatus Sodalis endolongispinus TaxID=2812662 RepID=A0ABS5YBV2_9GAMM|nr:ACP phosphodiesterase [Candidatus Sodalis endolongispinus]MBT9432505.1 DUF479 domain-containing protein [Candidatus Sodalis endolongispinus]